MEKFKLGFIVGRMQPIHKGHQQLIDLGLELCDRFIILLGSSNESRTKNNPFTFEERKGFIEKIYGDKVIVLPIVNIGIGYVPEWGNYLMNTIKFHLGEYPDFVIHGAEFDREEWIDRVKYDNLSEMTISRNLITTKASNIRDILRSYESSNKQKVRYLMDDKLYDDISNMEKIIHEVGGKK